MNTIQGNLIKKIKSYKTLQTELELLDEQIDKEARKLLKELQKIDGWECMIKECEEHYAKYPDEFFNWCSVSYTVDAIEFIKGYSDGGEYVVLRINLYEPLATQVQNRLVSLQKEDEEKQRRVEEKELAELERLKKKYENN